MGRGDREVERDIQEREDRFRLLERMGEFVQGQREREPLAEDQRDEA
jgi:hypothetical protein